MRKPKPSQPKQANRFVETARELGLDTDEANEAFERAFGKIAPPKKKEVASGNKDERPLHDD